MTLNPEILQIINEEESVLASVKDTIFAQSASASRDFNSHSIRARELTSELVGYSRDVDKQMIASDERVYHGLSEHKQKQLKSLDRMIERPYFARVVVEEERSNNPYTLEYKLGFVANPDCRIVDWRKAPIARLYYEYNEGQTYSELIQGNEREGIVKLRNTVDIKKGRLEKISCRYGAFAYQNGRWNKVGGILGESYGGLPDVLSLITKEQFQLITEQAGSAVFIQGVAGSGKTTVALYRLAWLLHQDNSDLKPEECLIVMRSKALMSYVQRTLPSMGVNSVRITTFQQWLNKNVSTLLKQSLKSGEKPWSLIDAPMFVSRVKQSLALLLRINELAPSIANREIPINDELLNILKNTSEILKHDRTGLLDKETITSCFTHTAENFAKFQIDQFDEILLVRLAQIKNTSRTGNLSEIKHIVVDEVQDFAPIELAVLAASAGKKTLLTFVGDSAQATRTEQAFPAWEELRDLWNSEQSPVRLTSLLVSHRSTKQIMRFAEYVNGSKVKASGRPGKPPLWIKCSNENEGLSQVIGWLNRVTQRFPSNPIAVLCRNLVEAQYALSLLSPTFGPTVHLGDEEQFTFSEGIVVAAIDHAKGLEFPHVLIWNPSTKSYPPNWKARNRLYVAATRAQEHLSFVTWDKPSPLLPAPESLLVRIYEPEYE